MADLPFADALSQSRSRISGMLRPPKEDLWDVGRAALRAAGSRGRQGFGQHLEAIMQAKRQEQKANLDAELANYEMMWKQVEANAASGDKKAQSLWNAAKPVLDKLEPSDIPSFYQKLDSLPDNTDPYAAVASASQGLAFTKDAEKGFTLSPGQVRYGPGGGVVARGPQKTEDKPLTQIAKLKSDYEAGRIAKDQYDAAVAKNLSRSGMEIKVNEDGSVTIREGDVGAFGELESKSRRDDAKQAVERLTNMREDVAAMIERVNADPTLAGAVGSVRRAGQTFIGALEDVGAGLGLTQATEMAQWADDIIEGLPEEERAEVRARFFDDPKLSQMRLFENTLGLILARLRVGEDNRMLAEVVKRSLEDAKTTGLTSSRDVVYRMADILRQLDREIASQNVLLGNEGQGQGITPAPPGETVPVSMDNDPLGIR